MRHFFTQIISGLASSLCYVAAQSSDSDFFLFPPALPLNLEFSSDATPVTLNFEIGSTQTLRWETKREAYSIVARVVLDAGESGFTLYEKKASDPERGSYSWTVPSASDSLPFWLFISDSGVGICKSAPFNISTALTSPLHSSHLGTSTPTFAILPGAPSTGRYSASASSWSTSEVSNNNDDNINSSVGAVGVKFGLRVGLGVGVPMLVLVLAGLVFRKRYVKKNPPPGVAETQQEQGPGLPEMGAGLRHEVSGKEIHAHRSEMDARSDVRHVELPGR